ncbi:MAG: Rrf2 family transcriptional regulator [Calditrichaeota bacterium]|nr:MAG: Rrf2 family transcriptional regulator [Calditrichota bacterium]
MKITAQEENGLRILLHLAMSEKSQGETIPEISEKVGLTQANVAKLCRIMRLADFITSTRGNAGGYLLARDAELIELNKVLSVLGGRLFDDDFCEVRSGFSDCCDLEADCSVRSLWQILQNAVDAALKNMTLGDLATSRHGTLNRITPVQQLDFPSKS